jgi:hypothetical protein
MITNLRIEVAKEMALLAIDRLSELAEAFPERVHAFIDSLDSLNCLIRVDADDCLTSGAGNVLVRLQPTDTLLDFLATFRAGDGNGGV